MPKYDRNVIALEQSFSDAEHYRPFNGRQVNIGIKMGK
jgi:hypothetical protein